MVVGVKTGFGQLHILASADNAPGTPVARVERFAERLKAAGIATTIRFNRGTEIGAAWRKTKQGSDETYLRVKLDDNFEPKLIRTVRGMGYVLENPDCA